MKKILIGLSILILATLVFWGCSFGAKKSGNKTGGGSGNTNQPPRNTYDGFGYDNNANGVWDDLDTHISNRYPSDVLKQNALKQMAKALQAGVRAGSTKNDVAAQSANKALSKGVYCLLERTGVDKFGEESSLLKVEMLKGDANRRKAYQEFNALLSGGFYGSDQKENPCE